MRRFVLAVSFLALIGCSPSGTEEPKDAGAVDSGAVASDAGEMVDAGVDGGPSITAVSLAISPHTGSMAAGATTQLTATITLSDESSADATAEATWTCNRTNVATVSGGLVTAKAVGTATITASARGFTATATVTVTPALLTSIVVTPAESTVALGLTQQFTAMAHYGDGHTTDVTTMATWQSTDASVATVVGGLASTLTTGTTTITATLEEKSGEATLTVLPAELIQIQVTPASPSVPLGASLPLAAQGTYTDGSTNDLTNLVTWSSANEALVTVSSEGRAMGVARGAAVVTAELDGILGQTTVTVGAPAVLSIAVTPANPSFVLGYSTQLHANATYTDGTSRDITSTATWSSSDVRIARATTGGSIQGVSAGIVAISASLGGITTAVPLTVLPPEVVALQVTSSRSSFPLGLNSQLTATSTYSDGSEVDVTTQVAWTSDNPNIASVSSTGLVTGVTQGAARFTATLRGKTGYTNITVTAPAPVGLSVAPPTLTLPQGVMQAVVATAVYTDGSSSDVSVSASWSTSNQAIATVTGGQITARFRGYATIQASFGGFTASTAVTVTPVALMNIAVTATSTHLPIESQQQLVAVGTYSDGTTKTLTNDVAWSSSQVGVVRVGTHGLVDTLAAGLSTVTATLAGVSGSIDLEVLPHDLVSIAMVADDTSIALGRQAQVRVTGTFADGLTADLTTSVEYANEDPSVATISTAGAVESLREGSTIVLASYEGFSATITLTVTAPEIVAVGLSPIETTLALGRSTTFTATATLTNGDSLDVTSTAFWTSSVTSVATVSGGIITSVSTGTTTITVSQNGFAASATLHIADPELVSIAVTSPGFSVAVGLTLQLKATGTYSNASTQDLSHQVTWTVANPTLASVDAQGLVLGLATGSTSISATLPGLSASVSISINPALLLSLAVTPATTTLSLGLGGQLIARASYTGNTTTDVSSSATWMSSDFNVVTVSGGTLTSHGEGTATITTTFGGFTSTSTVTVGPPVLTGITLTPPNPQLPLGLSVQMTATGSYTDGIDRAITSQVSWSSSSPLVATISASGLVQSTGVGSTSIRASLSGVDVSTDVVIDAPTPVTFSISPRDVSTPLGRAVSLSVLSTFTDGVQRDVTSQATWSSSDTGIVSFQSPGQASALAEGAVTVTATLGNLADSTSFTVTPHELLGVSLTSSATEVAKGLTAQLTAKATYTDRTIDVTGQVQWGSSNAAIVTVDSNGLLQGISAGSVVITGDYGNTQVHIGITVNPAALLTITISPTSPSVPKGSTVQLAAKGSFTDGVERDITGQVAWLSGNDNLAVVGGGLVAGLAEGTTTITAKSSTITASVTLTVRPHALVSLSLSPQNASVANGLTTPITATGTFTDGATGNVSSVAQWSSSDTNVATVLGGVVRGVTLGTVTITAESEGQSASTTVQVTDAVLQTLSVTPTTKSVPLGVSYQITATGHYSDNTDRDVTELATWTSTQPSIATVTAGYVFTKQQGSATIKAALAGLQATSTLSVTAKVLTSVAISPAASSTPLGVNRQLTLTGTYTDQSTANLTLFAGWTSSNTALATVSNGLVIPKSAGMLTISASYSGFNDSTPFTVAPAALSTISISAASSYTLPGGTNQLTAMGTYTDGSTAELTSLVSWQSSKTNIATVSSSGLITGVTPGVTNISASYQGVTGTFPMTVLQLYDINVNPHNRSVSMGDSLSMKANAEYVDPTDPFGILVEIVDVSAQASWSSADPSIATVSSAGVVSGLYPGTVGISALYKGMTGTTNVTVAGPLSITVTPEAAYSGGHIPVGASLAFVAMGNLPGGATQDLTSMVTWASSDTYCMTLSTVDPGVASGAHACGSYVLLTAQFAGITGTHQLIIDRVTGVVPSTTNVGISKGTSIPLGVQLAYANGALSGIDDGSPFVTWTSNNTSIATVDSTGVVVGRNNGSTYITVRFAADTSYYSTVYVNVVP